MTTATGSRLEHAIGPDGVLSIRLRDGELRLRTVDGETVRVHDRAGRDLSAMFTIESGDGSLSLRATRDPGMFVRRGRGATPDIEVELPHRTAIAVETVSADIDGHGLIGDQRYRTASGDLKLRAVSGRLAIESISGDLDIVATGEADVALRTVSGDIELRAGTLRSLRTSSTSGDVKLAGRLAGSGPFGIETVSGDALLAPAGEVRIEMTSLSGDFRSDVEGQVTGGRGRRSLSIGKDGPLLTFRSMSGDLRVVRATPSASASSSPRPAQVAEAEMVAPRVDPGPQPAPASTDGAVEETYDEARLRVLRSLERGEIDVIEAGRLLETLDRGGSPDGADDETRRYVAEPSDA